MKSLMVVLATAVLMMLPVQSDSTYSRPPVFSEKEFYDLTNFQLRLINREAEFLVQAIAQNKEIDYEEIYFLESLRFGFFEKRKIANRILKKYYHSSRKIDMAFSSNAEFIIKVLTEKRFWIKDNNNEIKRFYKAMFATEVNKVYSNFTILGWLVLFLGWIAFFIGIFRIFDAFKKKESKLEKLGTIVAAMFWILGGILLLSWVLL